MSSISAAKTIEKLREVFSIHGLPQKIVTDNGSAFTSREFGEFMKENGILHVTSAPYHPATNGLAENIETRSEEDPRGGTTLKIPFQVQVDASFDYRDSTLRNAHGRKVKVTPRPFIARCGRESPEISRETKNEP